MTLLYNRRSQRTLRKQLRNNIPEAEVILWSRLQGRHFGNKKFRRQYSIGPYVVDFYCPELKLAIEVDGDSHFTNEAEAYDRERTIFIESAGIRVIRFTNEEVRKHLFEVLAVIERETR